MLNLLTETEVAERLKVSLASIRRWRLEKRGPTFVKMGALVRYRPEDLDNWLASLSAQGDGRSRGTARDNEVVQFRHSAVGG